MNGTVEPCCRVARLEKRLWKADQHLSVFAFDFAQSSATASSMTRRIRLKIWTPINQTIRVDRWHRQIFIVNAAHLEYRDGLVGELTTGAEGVCKTDKLKHSGSGADKHLPGRLGLMLESIVRPRRSRK
jgi:hypothetical protein